LSFCVRLCLLQYVKHIGGVLVDVLAMIGVDLDHRFDLRSGKSKDCDISICCFFFTTHATLRSKNNGGLAQNKDNVSELRAKSAYFDILLSS
jgi:hypothetical protein